MPDAGRVRALEAGDADLVRALFRATAAVGHPLRLPEADLVAYQSLCLDYYLEEDGSACAVHVTDGLVRGYAMVARDHAAYQRWVRPRAARWAARAVGRIIRAPRSVGATFHRLRLIDGVGTLVRGVAAPMPAHVHFNVAAGHRGTAAGFALAAHADAVLGRAGLAGYFGEVNVVRSKPGRERALRRLGGVVVHRQHNHTLSWLAGEPVDRLTVVRSLDPVAGWVPLPAAQGRPPPMSRP